jgi:hypothetical protein
MARLKRSASRLRCGRTGRTDSTTSTGIWQRWRKPWDGGKVVKGQQGCSCTCLRLLQLIRNAGRQCSHNVPLLSPEPPHRVLKLNLTPQRSVQQQSQQQQRQKLTVGNQLL